jgi:hypothetical protein
VAAAPVKLGPEAAGFLATEHWGLLSARSLAWNEAFSRVSMFLTTLSASAVALALAADASGFGRSFRLFALVLFPIVLFLGITAYIRVCQINVDDIYIVLAMNRLRHAYIDEVPGLETYFTSGWTDDQRGVWQSYMLDQPRPPRPFLHSFVTTPTIVATIDAAVAAAGGALVLDALSISGPWSVVLSALVFLVTWVVLLLVQYRQMSGVPGRVDERARFPSET